VGLIAIHERGGTRNWKKLFPVGPARPEWRRMAVAQVQAGQEQFGDPPREAYRPRVAAAPIWPQRRK
jgi:hypothetical protein